MGHPLWGTSGPAIPCPCQVSQHISSGSPLSQDRRLIYISFRNDREAEGSACGSCIFPCPMASVFWLPVPLYSTWTLGKLLCETEPIPTCAGLGTMCELSKGVAKESSWNSQTTSPPQREPRHSYPVDGICLHPGLGAVVGSCTRVTVS